LHLYAQAIGVVPRVHGKFHPKWWHISFKVRENGLVTDDMDLPDGGSFRLRMDLLEHEAVISTSHGTRRSFSLREGLTSTEFGDHILEAVGVLGLEGEYARDRFEDDSPREYDPGLAERFFIALRSASQAFEQHRASLSGKTGPVQLWPHGFDLAFEWFGTRIETYEEKGEIREYPSQLNLGFSPGDDETAPYFYSNPWPFEEEQLVHNDLPPGARWYTESWQGTILPYDELVDDIYAAERLAAYARAVFEISSPTLTAQN
jgi:hypothetical protein